MDLVYKEKKLLVNVDEKVDIGIVRKLETRLDRILRDYNIENVEIFVQNKDENFGLFSSSVKNIRSNHRSNITLK